MRRIIATIGGLAVLTAMFLSSILFAGQSVGEVLASGIQQDNSNKPKKEKKEKKNKKDKDSNMMMNSNMDSNMTMNSNSDSNMMMNSNMDSNMMMNSNMNPNVNR